MSTLFLDISHEYKERDRESKKDKVFYNRTTTITLGEKVKLLSLGDTTLKFKRKTYRAWDKTLHNDVTTFSLDQVLSFKNKFLLIALYQYDNTDNFNDITSSTQSNLIRLDVIKNSFLQGIDLGLNISSTFLS